MLVGLNPVISKSVGVPAANPAQKLKDAVQRGMKLIVIDPRRTETARRAGAAPPSLNGSPSAIAALFTARLAKNRHTTSELNGLNVLKQY